MLIQRLLLSGMCVYASYILETEHQESGKIMSEPPDQFSIFSPSIRCEDNGNEEIENVVRCPHP